jgi:hypothetical protein
VAGRHRKRSTFRREHHRGRHRKPPSKPLTVVPAVVAVAVLAVGAVTFGHAVADGQAPKSAASLPGITPVLPSTPVPPSTPATPTPSASPSHAAAPDPGVPTPPASRRQHHHSPPAVFTMVDRHGDCYLQVRNSHGHLLAQRILRSGQRRSFAQHNLRVVLGNAGAAWISIDGRHSHRAGRAGQVRRFRVR